MKFLFIAVLSTLALAGCQSSGGGGNSDYSGACNSVGSGATPDVICR